MAKEKFKEKINKLLDILFPEDIKCIFCGDEISEKNNYNACGKCLKNLPYNDKNICLACGVKMNDLADICFYCFHTYPPYKIARAPFLYDYPISNLIQQFKFENAKYLFAPLGEFLIDTYKKNNYDCDLIIPVPLSKSRLKLRKYNQAEMLAMPLSKNFNLPIINNAVVRIKDTNKQANLTHSQRRENLKNAFQLVDKKSIKNKNVLVVDDVMTTGETIKNLCYELHKGKPKNIYVLTLAHTDFYRNKKIKYSKKLLDLLKNKLKTIKFNIKLNNNYKNVIKNCKNIKNAIKYDNKIKK